MLRSTKIRRYLPVNCSPIHLECDFFRQVTRAQQLPEAVVDALEGSGSAMTAGQLLALGLKPHNLAYAVRHGLLERLGRGRYALPVDRQKEYWAQRRDQHLRELAAALAAAPEAVAGLRSAALVWGLPVSTMPTRPEILRPANQARLAGVRTITTVIPPPVVSRLAMRVTSLARTATDVAIDLPIPEALVTIDAAVRAGARQELMLNELSLRGAVRGCRNARQALAWADGRAESPLESRGRGELLVRGVPVPDCNVVVSLGGYECRLDTFWEELGIAGEANGKLKYRGATANQDSLWYEKIRQEWLENTLELMVLRWDDRELRRDPDGLAERWRRLKRKRLATPWRPPSGLLFAERRVRRQMWPI